MFALVVRFDLKDARSAEEFDELVAATGEGIKSSEPGTLVYATHVVHDEPLVRVFYELYRDREAFEEHERQPHVQHFLAQRDRYVAAARVEFLTPGPSKGIG
ncbi:putative quinol monooxygenase [Dactylosporangium cerinum]|uniref:Quinol monooxygenase n=1 Tax=Dactylosporangium cerinum TaxID=1434730 RepID=A0ABV9VYH7_9ACTN